MTAGRIISLFLGFVCISQVNLRLIHHVLEHDPYHNHDCPSYLGCYNSSSTLGNYTKAIVASDAYGCSPIGRKLLEQGGSAVDAAIGVLLCMGVVTPESMGLGGGCLMVIYDEKSGESLVINGREHAPAAAHKDMFHGNATLANTGGLSVAIPGELYAYHEAHTRYGKLPWKDLFSGAIEMAQGGFPVGRHLARALQEKAGIIMESDDLK